MGVTRSRYTMHVTDGRPVVLTSRKVLARSWFIPSMTHEHAVVSMALFATLQKSICDLNLLVAWTMCMANAVVVSSSTM
jgi:hypothetical protein